MDKPCIPTPDMGSNTPLLRRSARLNKPTTGTGNEGNPRRFQLIIKYFIKQGLINKENGKCWSTAYSTSIFITWFKKKNYISYTIKKLTA